MEEPKLIQKLTQMTKPEIELGLYRSRLRLALLTKHGQVKQSQAVFGLAWKTMTVVSCSLALFLFLVINESLWPAQGAARAKEIAVSDPRVADLINQGAIIGDISVVEDQAVISLRSPLASKRDTMNLPAQPATQKSLEALPGARPLPSPSSETVFLVEVDLKKGEVSTIQAVEWTR